MVKDFGEEVENMMADKMEAIKVSEPLVFSFSPDDIDPLGRMNTPTDIFFVSGSGGRPFRDTPKRNHKLLTSTFAG